AEGAVNSEPMGPPLQSGTTWVTRRQPYVWTEIARYGQEIYPSPDYERAYWIADGEVHEGPEDDLDAVLARPQAKIFEGSREFFPYPHDPLYVLSDRYDGPADVVERFRAAYPRSDRDALPHGSLAA